MPAEPNTYEGDIRRAAGEKIRWARGRGGRRRGWSGGRGEGLTERLKEQRSLRKLARDELKRDASWADVISEGTGTGAISTETKAREVTEKVLWLTDPEGKHGGIGEAVTAPEEDVVTKEEDDEDEKNKK